MECERGQWGVQQISQQAFWSGYKLILYCYWIFKTGEVKQESYSVNMGSEYLQRELLVKKGMSGERTYGDLW